MWVKATALGFDGMQRRKVGEKFELKDVEVKVKGAPVRRVTDEDQFSDKWMKKIKTPKPEEDPDDLTPDEDDEAMTLTHAGAAARGEQASKKSGKGGRASDESKI